jgi:hypothetical protein
MSVDSDSDTVCSWFPSVSGSESGSGSIPAVYCGWSPRTVSPRCPSFVGITAVFRSLVSKSHLLSSIPIPIPCAPGSHRCRGRNRDRDRFRRCIVVGPHARCRLVARVSSASQRCSGLSCQNPIFCPSIPIPIPCAPGSHRCRGRNRDRDRFRGVLWLVTTHGVASLPEFRRHRSGVPVSRVKIPSFVRRFRFRYRVLLVPIGVGVGIGIGIDSIVVDRVSPRCPIVGRSGVPSLVSKSIFCHSDSDTVCSWFPSVSGSESGSGDSSGVLWLVTTHGVASLPDFVGIARVPVSRVKIPSFVRRFRFRYRPRPRL